ncbi:MAG: UDP-galactose-4-epimerase [Candidatus Saccharibacteria bacterium]|nr:UDP-galactose-4-epimerase [Candidatus Saccharibacteria bacterium]
MSGYSVVVADNLCNSSVEPLRRIEKLTGQPVTFYNIDLRDEPALENVFAQENFDGVIHFAGLKAVGDSVTNPLGYYDNNLLSTIVLCRVMARHNVKQLVFSSSATVYGIQASPKYVETMAMAPVNPYGHTKAMIEQILADLCMSDPTWRITALRYFNPIGAHPSGLIGEDPNGIPNNLFPFVMQVAVGKRPELIVFGNDYDTVDGTGVRDYIHVVDLALGHIAALEHDPEPGSYATYNLGSGSGSSVFEVVDAFKTASGRDIPYKVAPRRSGDLAIYYADPSKANRLLNWKTAKTLADACADGWKWQSQNPNGYAS